MASQDSQPSSRRYEALNLMLCWSTVSQRSTLDSA